MNTPQKSFAERAQELLAIQEAAALKQQTALEAAEDRRRRLLTEGPAVAQRLAAEVIAEIKQQVASAGSKLFSLPESPQLGAALEIIVQRKWLLTGEPSGSDFTVATRELVWLHNPRASQRQREELEYVTYQINLNQNGEWIWKEESGQSARGGAYMPQLHTIQGLTNTELVEEILNKALALAERNSKDTNGSGGFYVV